MNTNITTSQRLVRVSFRKAASDGNYGSESAEVTFEDYISGEASGEIDIAAAEAMLDDARNQVHRQLLRSPSLRVRESLNVPKEDVQRAPMLDDAYEEAPL